MGTLSSLLVTVHVKIRSCGLALLEPEENQALSFNIGEILKLKKKTGYVQLVIECKLKGEHVGFREKIRNEIDDWGVESSLP
jgi:hypothetical protein